MSESFSQFKVFSIPQDPGRQRNIARPVTLGLDSQKDVWKFSTFHIWRRREGRMRYYGEIGCILNLFSLQCLLISCSPDPRVVVLTLHFTLHCTFHRILFLRRKTGSGEPFCWHCCCYITINKDWQRNENNRNRFILLSTIRLLQLQWWFLSNFHSLCRGKPDGKSEALRPFYRQFLPQDHGAENFV